MKPWSYDPSPAIQQSIAQQLAVFPRERDLTHATLRTLWSVCLRLSLKGYFRLAVIGRERLPTTGSFVLVANHASHLDALALLCALPIRTIHRTFAVAAKDYFFSSFARSFFSAVFINAIPFDRREKKRESLELCADVLDVAQRALIMFPEGTRSPTGEMQPFKKGIGILTAGTDRLVVPAYLQGAYAAWPKDTALPRPRRVRVFIGEPMSFRHVPRTDEGFAQVAREVEAAVRALGASLDRRKEG